MFRGIEIEQLNAEEIEVIRHRYLMVRTDHHGRFDELGDLASIEASALRKLRHFSLERLETALKFSDAIGSSYM